MAMWPSWRLPVRYISFYCPSCKVSRIDSAYLPMENQIVRVDTSSKRKREHSDHSAVLKDAQLSASKINLSKEISDLQSNLSELLSKLISREELFHSTVDEFETHCARRLLRIKDDAKNIHAAAFVVDSKTESGAWEAEKVKLVEVNRFEARIKLDVGGIRFTTSLTTLRRFPDTMIGAMFSGRHALTLDDEGYYFIDRDGTHFRLILNFLRSPEAFELDLTGSALKEFKTECDYYGLLELIFPPPKSIPPFTCKNYYGDLVTIRQDENLVFSADNVVLYVCPRCFATKYTTGGPKLYHQHSVLRFGELVQSKGGVIASSQPKPQRECGKCGW